MVTTNPMAHMVPSGEAPVTKHLVTPNESGVGGHDYDDVNMRPADLPRADAHGPRATNKPARTARLTGGMGGVEVGSPGH